LVGDECMAPFSTTTLSNYTLKINGNQITQIKPTDKESQLAGGRPFVYGHALSSTRDKQGQTKQVVTPTLESHAETTQPRSTF